MAHRFRLLLLLAAILLGCNPHSVDQAKQIDEATFWVIVDSVKGADDEAAYSRRLARELDALSNDQLVQFYVLYQAAMENANRGDLRAAGVLLNGGHGSDDGFEYFRNWLIAQGSAVYQLAVADPDSLAAVDVPFKDGQPTAEWESAGYVVSNLFRNRTGGTLEQVAEKLLLKSRLAEASPFDWTDYPDEILAARVPKLWAKYGQIKVRRDRLLAARVKETELRMRTQEFEIPGLGRVKAGVVIYHKSYGAGTVLGVDKLGQDFFANISFSGEVHPMSLSAMPELFSLKPFRKP